MVSKGLLAKIDAGHAQGHDRELLYAALSILGDDRPFVQVFIGIEVFDASVKLVPDPAADFGDRLGVYDKHEIVSTDMADKTVFRLEFLENIDDRISGKLDYPVAQGESIMVVVCFEVIRIAVYDSQSPFHIDGLVDRIETMLTKSGLIMKIPSY